MDARWLKQLIIYILVLTVAAVSIITWDVYTLLKKPMLGSEKTPIVINLQHQTSAQQFVQALKAKGLVRSGKLFRLLIKMQGSAQDLKAGIYEIKPGESAWQFLKRVVEGDVLVLPFTIVEGTTFSQISKKLETAPYLNNTSSDWKPVSDNHGYVEGLLLADTYHYQAGSSSTALLNQANQALSNYLDVTWEHRDPNLPYQSAYEMLIAASILEKEAALDIEKKLISGVIVNRLKLNMRLQMDPTVIYALGSDYKGKLTHADLAVDSPYNTYKYRGLPPTPIAMVGKKAIDAAAHPKRTDYLYFVAKGDGSHQFSETYEQQRQAIKRYQPKED